MADYEERYGMQHTTPRPRQRRPLWETEYYVRPTSVPDFSHLPLATQQRLEAEMREAAMHQLIIQTDYPNQEEVQEMAWTNPEAQKIAREILSEAKTEELRDRVTAAVKALQEQIAGANCGSVFSFMKKNDDGQHYWYAAIKNGGKWYTTAQNPRIIENDDLFIEWLVSLEVYESEATELTAGAPHVQPAIEVSSTDD